MANSTLNKEISEIKYKYGYITKNLEVHSANENPRNYSDDKGTGNHGTLQSIFSSHPDSVVNVLPGSVAAIDASDFKIAASVFKGRSALQGLDISGEHELALREVASRLRSSNLQINKESINNAINDYFGQLESVLTSQSEKYDRILEIISEQNQAESIAYNPDFPLNDVNFTYIPKGASRANDLGATTEPLHSPNVAFGNQSGFDPTHKSLEYIQGTKGLSDGGFGVSPNSSFSTTNVLKDIVSKYGNSND
jgi:hypothetical protein